MRSASPVPILHVMGGSAAEAPTTPDAEPIGRVRASDAERDEVLARLREEFAAGRLSQDTFLLRMDAVLSARNQADLPPLLADLPPSPAAAVPASAVPGSGVPESITSGPGALGSATPGSPTSGSGLATPDPAMPARGAAAPSMADQAVPFPADGQASLITRLRALPGRRRSGAARQEDPGSWTGAPRGGLASRLTSAMRRAPAEPRRPIRLRFPRGPAHFFSIGRDVGCDLSIADMTVSRMHARLERTPEGWLLTDLASTNGTRVNGWLVRGQMQVREGDLVSFGRAEYWLSPADRI